MCHKNKKTKKKCISPNKICREETTQKVDCHVEPLEIGRLCLDTVTRLLDP